MACMGRHKVVPGLRRSNHGLRFWCCLHYHVNITCLTSGHMCFIGGLHHILHVGQVHK